jgi:cytochrome c-type biogenesis protein CcmH
MRLRNLSRALVLGTVLLLAVQQPVLAEDTVTDVGEGLMCMCGCGSLLTSCLHAECGVQKEMITYIEQALDRGESSGQIAAFFVSQYGDEVLSTPPKKGFNLVAWILPFVALLLGGGIVYLVLTKWVRRGQEVVPARREVDLLEAQDEEYRERLERDLSDYSGRSFR